MDRDLFSRIMPCMKCLLIGQANQNSTMNICGKNEIWLHLGSILAIIILFLWEEFILSALSRFHFYKFSIGPDHSAFIIITINHYCLINLFASVNTNLPSMIFDHYFWVNFITLVKESVHCPDHLHLTMNTLISLFSFSPIIDLL